MMGEGVSSIGMAKSSSQVDLSHIFERGESPFPLSFFPPLLDESGLISRSQCRIRCRVRFESPHHTFRSSRRRRTSSSHRSDHCTFSNGRSRRFTRLGSIDPRVGSRRTSRIWLVISQHRPFSRPPPDSLSPFAVFLFAPSSSIAATPSFLFFLQPQRLCKRISLSSKNFARPFVLSRFSRRNRSAFFGR